MPWDGSMRLVKVERWGETKMIQALTWPCTSLTKVENKEEKTEEVSPQIYTATLVCVCVCAA